MDHSRHSKRHRSSSKSKKSSKKKRSHDENGSGMDNIVVSVSSSIVKPLVEYSDVSSEDLSEPEAGEIQSEESPSFSDGDHHRSAHHSSKKLRSVIDDERDSYRHLPRKSLLAHSPSRRTVGSRLVDSAVLSHSPSPLDERKHSVSSDVSRSSSMRHRKRHDSSPLGFTMRAVISTPTLELEEYDIRRHRKKKEKKHKRDKKSKKKKKKSKRRSHSTSPENISGSPDSRISKSRISPLSDREQLSDWEAPLPNITYRTDSADRVDNVTCSPVSPPSNRTSPEPLSVHERISSPGFSPRTGTPPQPPPPARKYLSCGESPHTPQLPPKAYESSKIEDDDFGSTYSGRKQLSGSPILSDHHHSLSPPSRIDNYHGDPNWGRQHSLSPVKSSPFRNPSPDVQIISSGSMSPSRKRRRIEKELSHSHKKHRKEKERLRERRRMSRSRSPMMRRHRSSRSPSWGRSRHYSRSSSRTRTSKRYRSRSPKRIPSRSPPPR